MSLWGRLVQVGAGWGRLGLFGLVFVLPMGAAAQEPAPADVLHVSSKLVVLDATVLDKAGRMVTVPLGRDDFQITEDKKPQTIYSFESANQHAAVVARGNTDESPLMIFVLDELNYAYERSQTSSWNVMEQMMQYVYERTQLRAFLASQPAQLHERTEVLALTHHGFVVVAQPTVERDVVLQRVQARDPGLGQPFRDFLEETGGGSGIGQDFTLTRGSMSAIFALALQQRGVPGRKLVMWLGYGGPNRLSSKPVRARTLTAAEIIPREITNLLVDARITLNIFGPGMGPAFLMGTDISTPAEQSVSYRYESDFGFSGFVTSTGGKWKNGNDVRGEIQEAEFYGTTYYTLSYRPSDHEFNGDFRRIRVTVKGHPEWTVLTKAGYYAMQYSGEKSPEEQARTDLSVAAFEAMPFDAVGVTLVKVERIGGTGRVRFTFDLDSSNLQWHTDEGTGKRVADVAVAGAARKSVFDDKLLASNMATWRLDTPEDVQGRVRSTVSVAMQVPAGTQRLRFAVRDLGNGRMGTVDLKPSIVANAPVVEEPGLGLQPRDGDAGGVER